MARVRRTDELNKGNIVVENNNTNNMEDNKMTRTRRTDELVKSEVVVSDQETVVTVDNQINEEEVTMTRVRRTEELNKINTEELEALKEVAQQIGLNEMPEETVLVNELTVADLLKSDADIKSLLEDGLNKVRHYKQAQELHTDEYYASIQAIKAETAVIEARLQNKKVKGAERETLMTMLAELKEELLFVEYRLLSGKAKNRYVQAYNNAVRFNKVRYNHNAYVRNVSISDVKISKSKAEKELKKGFVKFVETGYVSVPYNRLLDGFEPTTEGTIELSEILGNSDSVKKSLSVNLGESQNLYGEKTFNVAFDDFIMVDVDAELNGMIANKVLCLLDDNSVVMAKTKNLIDRKHSNVVDTFRCISSTNGNDKKNVLLYVKDSCLETYNNNMDNLLGFNELIASLDLVGLTPALKDLESVVKRMQMLNNQTINREMYGVKGKGMAVVLGKIEAVRYDENGHNVHADFDKENSEKIKGIYEENFETFDGGIFVVGEFNRQLRGSKLQIKGLTQGVTVNQLKGLANHIENVQGLTIVLIGCDKIEDAVMLCDLNAIKHLGVTEIARAVNKKGFDKKVAKKFVANKFANIEIATLKASKGSEGANSSKQFWSKLDLDVARTQLSIILDAKLALANLLSGKGGMKTQLFIDALGADQVIDDEVAMEEYESEKLQSLKAMMSKDRIQMDSGAYVFLTFDAVSTFYGDRVTKGVLGKRQTRYGMLVEAFSFEFYVQNKEKIEAIENSLTLTNKEKKEQLDVLMSKIAVKYPSQGNEEFQMLRMLTLKELMELVRSMDQLSTKEQDETIEYFTVLNTNVTFLAAINYLKNKLAGLDVDGDSIVLIGGAEVLEAFAVKHNNANNVVVIVTRSDEKGRDELNKKLYTQGEDGDRLAKMYTLENDSMEQIVNDTDRLISLKTNGENISLQSVADNKYRYVVLNGANKMYKVNQIGSVTNALSLARLNYKFLLNTDGTINTDKFRKLFNVNVNLTEGQMTNYDSKLISIENGNVVEAFDVYGDKVTFFLVNSKTVQNVLEALRNFNCISGTVEHVQNLIADLQHIARALQESTIDMAGDSAKVFTIEGTEEIITHTMFVNETASAVSNKLAKEYVHNKEIQEQFKMLSKDKKYLNEAIEIHKANPDDTNALYAYSETLARKFLTGCAISISQKEKARREEYGFENKNTYIIDDSFEYKVVEAAKVLQHSFISKIRIAALKDGSCDQGFLPNYKAVEKHLVCAELGHVEEFMLSLLSFAYESDFVDMLKEDTEDFFKASKAKKLANNILLAAMKQAFGEGTDVKEAVASLLNMSANFEQKGVAIVKVRQVFSIFEKIAFEVLTDATRASLEDRGALDKLATIKGVNGSDEIEAFNNLRTVKTVLVKANRSTDETAIDNVKADLIQQPIALADMKAVNGVYSVVANFKSDEAIDLNRAVKVVNTFSNTIAFFLI